MKSIRRLSKNYLNYEDKYPVFGRDLMDNSGTTNGPHWTKIQLRGIQCILHTTHGVVGPRKPFFEKAFGKDAGEFKYIIEQPEELIFHRENRKPYEEHFVTALSNV